MTYTLKKKKKIVRKFKGGVNGLPNYKRLTKPGVHGKKREGKLSDYGKGLFQKNKLRACYGIKEKQFRNYFSKALKGSDTETELLVILETRLDNIVYRLGLAPSLPAARQMVVHGHFEVQSQSDYRKKKESKDTTSEDNKEVNKEANKSKKEKKEKKEDPVFEKVDKPSYQLRVGQLVRISPKVQKKKLFETVKQARTNASVLDWLTIEEESFCGYINTLPQLSQIPTAEHVQIADVIVFASRTV